MARKGSNGTGTSASAAIVTNPAIRTFPVIRTNHANPIPHTRSPHR